MNREAVESELNIAEEGMRFIVQNWESSPHECGSHAKSSMLRSLSAVVVAAGDNVTHKGNLPSTLGQALRAGFDGDEAEVKLSIDTFFKAEIELPKLLKKLHEVSDPPLTDEQVEDLTIRARNTALEMGLCARTVFLEVTVDLARRGFYLLPAARRLKALESYL